MKITVGDTSVELPGNKYPKSTELFVGILLTIIDKAKDNPTVQLHTLSLLTTGKPFIELLSQDDNLGIEYLLSTLSTLAESTIDTVLGGNVNLSDLNIDDILGKNNA